MSRIQSFELFWPFYLSQHLNRTCRGLHFIGTAAALGVAVWAGVRDPRWLPAALIAGYGPAWIGHFFFERNRPATFKYPLWSLICDFKMWTLMATGRLPGEMKRLGLDREVA
jgi:hypothetical protein